MKISKLEKKNEKKNLCVVYLDDLKCIDLKKIKNYLNEKHHIFYHTSRSTRESATYYISFLFMMIDMPYTTMTFP